MLTVAAVTAAPKTNEAGQNVSLLSWRDYDAAEVSCKTWYDIDKSVCSIPPHYSVLSSLFSGKLVFSQHVYMLKVDHRKVNW